MNLVLDEAERRSLFKQAAATEKDGGWQSLMVGLQRKCDQQTGAIAIDEADVEKIRRYAFTYGNGGWESRLVAIFGRQLGPKLDKQA